MSESKHGRSHAKPERLVREDLHKRPEQGKEPYHDGPHRHPGEDTGPWQPFALVPAILRPRPAGESGFTTSDDHVPGPFAGVPPRGYARTDTRVLEDVCDLLTVHGELDVRQVDVHCRNGVIRIEGHVPDERTRRLVEDVAREVLGVTGVENHLELGA
jgi:hypothetical protein